MIKIAIIIAMMGMSDLVAVLPNEIEVPMRIKVKKSRGKGRFNTAPYFARFF